MSKNAEHAIAARARLRDALEALASIGSAVTMEFEPAPEVPEDLAGLSLDELQAHRTAIAEWAASVADEASTPDLVDALVAAADALGRVDTAIGEAETAAAELDERRRAAMAALTGDEGDGGDGEGEGEGDGEGGDGDAGDAPADPEPVSAATRPAAITRMAERKNLRKAPKPAVAAAATVAAPELRATAEAARTGFARLDQPVNDVELMADIVVKRLEQGRSVTQRDKIVLASATAPALPGDRQMTEDNKRHNTRVLRELASLGRRAAITASGACIAPLAPNYELMGYATPQSPVENHLPTVGVPRLGMKWWPPLDWRQGKTGIETFTMDQLTDDEVDIDKPAVRVACPADPEEAHVEALTFIVEMGNETQKAFPELVARFLEDMRTYYATYKEIKYLNAIDAATTDVTVTASEFPFGFSPTALSQWMLAATGFRKRHNLPRSTKLDLYLPDNAIDNVVQDLLAHQFISQPAAALLTDAEVTALLSKLNFNAVWCNDQPTGLPTNLLQAQAAGALNQGPDTIWWRMTLPGSIVRMDGGTLDAGLQRSPELNRKNDLQFFFEEWTAAVFVGLEVIGGNVTVKLPGARAATVTSDAAGLVASAVTTLP